MKKGLIAFLVMACVLMLIFTACSGRGSSAGQTYTLRFGHVLTENDVYHTYMLEWADAVRQATNGGLNIEIFPTAQLGSEEDVLEQIRQGANMGWQTDFARLGSYVRDLSVVNAPFFVDNLDEAFMLGQSATIQRLNDELASSFGIANISFTWVQGDRHVFANTIARSPSEMRGLRIRTPPAPIWVESVSALGATPTPLAFGEIYTGISTRVVDGAELPYNAALNLNLQEVTRYTIETGHIFQLNSMVVSQAWLDRLPEEYRRIMIEACDQAGRNASLALAAQTADSRQTMVNQGMTVIGRDQLDMAAFVRDSVQAYDALGLTTVRASVHADIGKR